MKAIVYETYGNADRLQYTDIEQPQVDDDSILIQVHAASINKLDEHVLRGKPFPLRFMTGLFRPKWKVLGSDFSGVVKDVGTNITDFQIGDEVFGQRTIKQNGSFAQYTMVSPKQLTHKPANVPHIEAATLPIAGLTALQALQVTGVKQNTKLLIYGASGGVGTFAIQIAKAFGAHVTAVCSTRNIEVAKQSKADVVIDYKTEVWDKDGIQYDVIVAVNGYNSTKRYRNALKQNGTCIILGGDIKDILKTNIVQLLTPKKGRTFLGHMTKVVRQDLETLAKLIENQDIHPYIDHEYPLEQTKEAVQHFMSGQTIGKTIITMT